MVRLKPTATRLSEAERRKRTWNDATINLQIEAIGDLGEELVELSGQKKIVRKSRKSEFNSASLSIYPKGKLLNGTTDVCLLQFPMEMTGGNDVEVVSKVFHTEMIDTAIILPDCSLADGHLMLFVSDANEETSLLHCLTTVDAKSLFSALKYNRNVAVAICDSDFQRQQLIVGVFIRPNGFVQLRFPAEVIGNRPNFQPLLDLFPDQFGCHHSCFSLRSTSSQHQIGHHHGEVDRFYAAHKVFKKEMIGSQEDISHAALIPTLRKYQQSAISFMLSREKSIDVGGSTSLHQLFREITTVDGTHLYYNSALNDCRAFVREKPLVTPMPLGGFLCDEMGLGKTVEVLATILLHPKPKCDDGQRRIQQTVEGTVQICCFCGANSTVDQFDSIDPLIQCRKCWKSQHVGCVNWDANWNSGDYLCPHCVALEDPIAGGATLIISPESICDQWQTEIQKHISGDHLKVYVYRGVETGNYAQPKFLAQMDIVLCTYETLRKELNFVDLPHSDRFRKPKRFMTTPSPITAVKWWRICLDEAQLVEGTSQAAEMCLKLSADIRWCVTGTPMSKSVNDLYGLCLFIGIDPFFMRRWWDQLLWLPFSAGDPMPLVSAVAPYFWRTEKAEVVAQLHIPQQSAVEYRLDFAPVEAHFYTRIVDECRNAVTKILAKWADQRTKLSDLHSQELDAMLRPLLKLRQACCHPQIVRGQFVRMNKKIITMGEVLEAMIKKTVVECEDQQRIISLSLNGLAGLDIVEHNNALAAEKYREVLLADRNRNPTVRTDPLQLIHAMTNLNELILTDRNSIPPAIMDDQIPAELEKRKAKFISSNGGELLKEAKRNLETIRGKLTALREKLDGGKDWWAEFLDICAKQHNFDAVYDRITSSLFDGGLGKELDGFGQRFRDANGLKLLLFRYLKDVAETKQQADSAVAEILGIETPSEQMILTAQRCHLRPDETPLAFRCQICTVEDSLDPYEWCLFKFKRDKLRGGKGGRNEESHDVGMMRVTADYEKCLKVLQTVALSMSKSAKGELSGQLNSLADFGSVHLALIEELKTEFTAMRTVWKSFDSFVGAHEEIVQAVERFQVKSFAEVAEMRRRKAEELRNEREAVGSRSTTVANPVMIIHIISEGEVDQTRWQLQLDMRTAERMLEVKLGQLKYLEGLKENQTRSNGANVEECPVCKSELGTTWVVLSCGHCLCTECLPEIQKRTPADAQGQLSVKCPVCRVRTRQANISHVSTESNTNSYWSVGSAEKEIVGSYSTKVESIVRCLWEIHRQDPAAKCLVFSTWKEVLEIVESALTDNQIPFTVLGKSGKFRQNLKLFKTSDTVNTMLMSFNQGGKGLNITEATQVLLVEPLLSKGAELQAIGRVDRIGQTRPTRVHRFLMRRSIEEKIADVIGSLKATQNLTSSCSETATLAETDLTIADIRDLFD